MSSDLGQAQRANGSVKLVKVGQYAIVVPDTGGLDVFVHWSEVRNSKLRRIFEGDRISFVPTKGREGKGPRGVQITKLIV